MIISVINQKGGAGKTMLTVNLAAFASSDIPTAIIDLDPQATASAWYQMRKAKNIQLRATHPPLLKSTIQELQDQGMQMIIIDTPPHNSTATANAVQISDYCLIPVRPSAFDLVAAQATIDLVSQNNGKAGFVINAVPSSTNVEEEAKTFIETTGFAVVGSLGQRMAFQHASSQGLGVTEYEPNGKATGEVINLWNELRSISNG